MSIAVLVMAGLVPAIHVLASQRRKTWMPGTSPGTTALKDRGATDPYYSILRHRLFDQFIGGFRQQLVGCFAINRLAADFQHHRHRERRNMIEFLVDDSPLD